MAGEIVRSDANPTYETRRPGLDEDRYAGVEGRASEEGPEAREEGLAEDGSTFQAVAPILPDRCAAFPALSALRGLIRLHDDEIRARDLVPSRLTDEEEGEIIGPCLELDEREFLRGEQFIDALYEVPRILEPDDFLLIAQVEPGLSEVQFLVEPVEILRLYGELERAESQVDIAEEGVRLEHLGHAESEPVREDAGDRAIRLRPVFGDERRFAARVDSHALGEDSLRGRDREAEIDEGRVDFVDDRLDLRRLRTGRGFRFRRLHLRFFRFEFGLFGLFRLPLFPRLFLCFHGHLFGLSLLGPVLLPELQGLPARIPVLQPIRVVLFRARLDTVRLRRRR